MAKTTGAQLLGAKELERMHASLESTVTEAAKAQKKTLPAWNRYLVQFQVSARLNYRGPAGMTPLLILAGSLLGTRSWTVGRAISPSFISSGPAAIRMCCFTDMHDGLFDFREPGSSSRPVRV